MQNPLSNEEAAAWDELCRRLDVADDFRSSEVSFILDYLKDKGQLQALFEFAAAKASARDAQARKYREMETWEAWCLATCRQFGISLANNLPSEAALQIERLAPTGLWTHGPSQAVGSAHHQEWILSRLRGGVHNQNGAGHLA